MKRTAFLFSGISMVAIVVAITASGQVGQTTAPTFLAEMPPGYRDWGLYEVTVVKDATADYGDEFMRAALDINLPGCASAIMTTEKILSSISSRKAVTATTT